jgi:nicotinamide-nucleotide amidase
MRRPEQSLAENLKKNNLTIALAESMTCGLAAHTLCNTSSASEFLKGSIVCYDEKVKISLFGISQKIIDKHTAESKKVTDLLANKLSTLIRSDISAAITGLASQGGSETKVKPVGTVFLAVKFKGRIYSTRKVFRGSPLMIKKKSCSYLFLFINKIIKRR